MEQTDAQAGVCLRLCAGAHMDLENYASISYWLDKGY